jgi:predicted ATP-grasp superfamily ATP-dependent carboligase
VDAAGLQTNMSKPDSCPPLPPVIIFGGYFVTLTAGVNLATRSIPVYVLNERWEEARFSRYVRAIRLPANGRYPQSAMDFLTGSASNHLKGSVLLAGGDEELEIMAKNREALAGRFRLDLSNPVAQLTMLDKLATYSAAKEAGVTTPRFWQVQSEEDIHRLRDELVYPLIVKPKVSHVFQKKFKAKFFVAEGFDQLLEAHRAAESAHVATLLVEKIPGPDSRCCSYYTYLDEEGNALFDFTKRIIRRYPINMGLASYHVTDRVEHVRELSLKLFRHVGLQGLANAEFKYDERDGQLKLMECNARFTAGNSLVARAGFDLGNFVYNRIAGISQPPLTDFRTGLRLWDPLRDWRAFLELRKRGELTFMQWLASIMHWSSISYFSWRDPLPTLLRLRKTASSFREPRCDHR